ncbi:MAG: hypothetical protein QM689_13235 [Oscillospiraceae bacterium]
MNLRRSFKHVNRGLLLTLAVVIGLSVYISADTARFLERKPILESTVEDYIRQGCTLAVTPEKFRDGEVFTDAEARADFVRYSSLIDEFFTDEIDPDEVGGYYGSMCKDALKAYYKTEPETGYVTACTADQFTVEDKINKIGPGLAQFRYKVTITTEFWGAPAIFIPMCPNPAYETESLIEQYIGIDYIDPDDETAPTPDTESKPFHHYRIRMTYNGEVFLQYSDEGCKIISIYGYGSEYESTYQQLDKPVLPDDQSDRTDDLSAVPYDKNKEVDTDA